MQTAKNSAVQKKKTSTKTVTIETSGGITKKKVKSGGSVILPVEVNKRGYTFLGWSTVPGQTCNPMYQAYQKIQVTKNIHLYPVKYKWNQEPDIYAGGLADSVEKYDKIIFVGDSRTAMLRSTLKQQCSPCCLPSCIRTTTVRAMQSIMKMTLRMILIICTSLHLLIN